MAREINLIRAAIAGAAVTLAARVFERSTASAPSAYGGAAYWLGVAMGGAVLFVVIAAIVNRYRR